MSFQKPIFLGLGFAAGILIFGSTAAAQPKSLVFVADSALKAGVLYDAWVEFRDKGNPDPRERQAIWAALEKEFHPRALSRRKLNRSSGSGLFDSGDFFRREGKSDPLFVHGYGVPDVFLAAGLKKDQ